MPPVTVSPTRANALAERFTRPHWIHVNQKVLTPLVPLASQPGEDVMMWKMTVHQLVVHVHHLKKVVTQAILSPLVVMSAMVSDFKFVPGTIYINTNVAL